MMGTNNRRGRCLVHGVGYNDIDAPTKFYKNGKLIILPDYDLWQSMIRRAYSSKSKNYYSCYKGVTVHPDWHIRSKFNQWLDSQPQANWQELQIDKDLLVKGNRVYGPDTCCFLTHQENSTFRPYSLNRLGSAYFDNSIPNKKKKRIWRARKSDGSHLGWFSTKEEGQSVAMRESMPLVIEIANSNPHKFIREAMYRWIDDWKTQLLLLESAFQKNEEKNGTLQDHLC
jgi:hypothetical protein